MSVEDLAACNLNLHTAGRHTTNLWGASCHRIKKNTLLAVTRVLFRPFWTVLYTLFHYYITIIRIISKSEMAFGCVFIADHYYLGWALVEQWRWAALACEQCQRTAASMRAASAALKMVVEGNIFIALYQSCGLYQLFQLEWINWYNWYSMI